MTTIIITLLILPPIFAFVVVDDVMPYPPPPPLLPSSIKNNQLSSYRIPPHPASTKPFIISTTTTIRQRHTWNLWFQNQPHTSTQQSSKNNLVDGDDDDDDNLIRNLSTESLMNVLNPPHMDPAKALKKRLRKVDSQSSRKRLVDLILGTSVMRLRHLYVLSQLRNEAFDFSLWDDDDDDDGSGEMKDTTLQRPYDWDTVRALVDLHHDYLHNVTHDDYFHQLLTPSITAPSSPHHHHSSLSPAWHLSLTHSLPPILSRLLLSQYSFTDATTIATISNRPGPITLRRNCLLCPSDTILAERLLADDGISARPPPSASFATAVASHLPSEGCLRLLFETKPSSIWNMDAWQEGWFEVQDVGSQIIANAMDIGEGETIVDYCAGNGGKTLAMASIMGREGGGGGCGGTIVAHDVDVMRLRQLRGRWNRIVELMDGDDEREERRQPVVDVIVLDDDTEVERQRRLPVGTADAVLVDAPCSSTGVLRRMPGHRWRLTSSQVFESFPRMQLNILKEARRTVRSDGGRLVYATCSVWQGENEWVAHEFERFLMAEADGETWERWNFDHGENELAIGPHENDSDGFFIARWRRVA